MIIFILFYFIFLISIFQMKTMICYVYTVFHSKERPSLLRPDRIKQSEFIRRRKDGTAFAWKMLYVCFLVSVGWLVGRSVGWLVGRSVGRLVGWSSSTLTL